MCVCVCVCASLQGRSAVLAAWLTCFPSAHLHSVYRPWHSTHSSPDCSTYLAVMLPTALYTCAVVRIFSPVPLCFTYPCCPSLLWTLPHRPHHLTPSPVSSAPFPLASFPNPPDYTHHRLSI